MAYRHAHAHRESIVEGLVLIHSHLHLSGSSSAGQSAAAPAGRAALLQQRGSAALLSATRGRAGHDDVIFLEALSGEMISPEIPSEPVMKTKSYLGISDKSA